VVADTVKREDDVFQRFLFFGELLCTLGVVPDLGVFEFAGDGV
jgi:hypothetical protein